MGYLVSCYAIHPTHTLDGIYTYQAFSASILEKLAYDIYIFSLQVLLKWSLQQGVAVIPKSIQEAHINEFAPSHFEGWELTPDDLQMIHSLDDNHKFCWDPSCVQWGHAKGHCRIRFMFISPSPIAMIQALSTVSNPNRDPACSTARWEFPVYLQLSS